MLPPDSGEPIEVGGNHGTAVFHRDRRVLSGGDQLPRRTRFTAQPLEDLQSDRHRDRRSGPSAVRRETRRRQRRFPGSTAGRISGDSWRFERILTGQGPKGRTVPSCCQSGEPTRVLGPFRNDVLKVRVDQHIDVGKEYRLPLTHRPNCPRSSSASSDLGESRSTPGEGAHCARSPGETGSAPTAPAA